MMSLTTLPPHRATLTLDGDPGVHMVLQIANDLSTGKGLKAGNKNQTSHFWSVNKYTILMMEDYKNSLTLAINLI